MKTCLTIPDAAYVLTVRSTPCVVTAVLPDGKTVNLLTANETGQYGIVAPSTTVTVSQDDALLNQACGAVSFTNSDFGKSWPHYIHFDEEGRIVSFNIDSLKKASYLFATQTFGFDELKLHLSLPQNGLQMFHQSSGLKNVDITLENVVSASYLFNEARTIEQAVLKLPNATEGRTLFKWCDALKCCEVYAPKLLDCTELVCYCYKLEELIADMENCTVCNAACYFQSAPASQLRTVSLNCPKLKNATNMFRYCANLENLTMQRSNITIGTGMHLGCRKITSLPDGFPSLETGVDMFRGAGLDTATINMVLESLPSYTSGLHIITFTGCPGAAGADATIGMAKGWTVEL